MGHHQPNAADATEALTVEVVVMEKENERFAVGIQSPEL